MGCLKNLLKAIIIVLAVIGFVTIGGKDMVMNLYNKWSHTTQEDMLEKASKVGDFSRISEEYEIDKTASAFGYKGVIAEHNATGQKLIIVDTGKKPLLTKKDFQDGVVDKKLTDLQKKFKYQAISVDELKVTKRGTMYAYGKSAPYVKFEAKIKKLPVGEINGIIGIAETKSGDDRVIISANQKGKYSQLIAQEFFKQIR